MKLTIKLFANFREGRFDIAEGEYAEGITVGQIVDQLELPQEKLGILMVNSRHVKLERVMSEGETLAIFPLVGGG